MCFDVNVCLVLCCRVELCGSTWWQQNPCKFIHWLDTTVDKFGFFRVVGINLSFIWISWKQGICEFLDMMILHKETKEILWLKTLVRVSGDTSWVFIKLKWHKETLINFTACFRNLFKIQFLKLLCICIPIYTCTELCLINSVFNFDYLVNVRLKMLRQKSHRNCSSSCSA